MRSIQTLQMAVESPTRDVRVIRTAGTLDRHAAAALLRLLDGQIAVVGDADSTLTHLIIDLANVSRFEPGGMETLHQHRGIGHDRKVRLHLAGAGGHLCQLPVRVRQLIRDFSTFPTTEAAIVALTAERDQGRVPAATRVEPDRTLRLPESRRPSFDQLRVVTHERPTTGRRRSRQDRGSATGS